MLESLAAWVLRTYVGEYVENLNTDQLSIGYGKDFWHAFFERCNSCELRDLMSFQLSTVDL